MFGFVSQQLSDKSGTDWNEKRGKENRRKPRNMHSLRALQGIFGQIPSVLLLRMSQFSVIKTLMTAKKKYNAESHFRV